MLRLRKEIKVGFGIGAAVLGVAAVYGGMAMLTSRGGDSVAGDKSNAGQVDAPGDGGKDFVVGLPKADDPVATIDKGKTEPAKKTEGAGTTLPPVDPFSEITRSDGTTNDPWTTALATGRVPSGKGHDLIVTKTPDPAKVDPGRKAATDLDASSGGAKSETRVDAKAPDGGGKSAPVEGQKYVIAAGDTFSSIAGKVYGDKRLYTAIAKANPTIDPAKLRVGTEIVVPASDAVKSERGSMGSPAKPITSAIDTTREYRIQSGDTLHGISKRLYGKTSFWMAIYDLNKPAIGPDAGKLKVGTVLQLPQRPDAR